MDKACHSFTEQSKMTARVAAKVVDRMRQSMSMRAQMQPLYHHHHRLFPESITWNHGIIKIQFLISFSSDISISQL